MLTFVLILKCGIYLNRNIVEPLKGKFPDISRPINDSFRHTGHGSVLGNSWGNPSFLDPNFLGDDKNAHTVHLRGTYSIRSHFYYNHMQKINCADFIFFHFQHQVRQKIANINAYPSNMFENEKVMHKSNLHIIN